MLFTSACSRDSLPSAEEQLVGRWEWVESTGEATTSVTPASTGHRVWVDFDRRGRARFYEDGTLRSAAAFSVRRAAHAANRKRPFRHMIIYRGYQSNQFYSVSGNRLYIQDATGKASSHIYRRASHSEDTEVAANDVPE
ncbi:hypothetical protein HMJ29_12120 [Hymenobacter taeanensis]|uniref:Lipocalin-like domain-containing protein n=1 Tax=Hymenobacter taeanensis TaxID=2735321 RepID=A0A6M6BIE4_9BACT|nr:MULTISPECIES: hypothetical protein [Hymenobacter]QJX47648.1 hypothetical protein HMJ29_12120 [Hymenobacter taeanensis]UOQ82870.1 hypothetical protein MUN83_08955 [Hymenobacter sp. 5414T-23]